MKGRSSDEKNERTSAACSAAAASRLWNEAHLRLSPVIGDLGFDLLYRRSVHLTSHAFPCLAQAAGTAPAPVAAPDAARAPPFAELAGLLEREAPEQAAQANQALYTTFTRLLNVLIGENLATRLLASATYDDDPDEYPDAPPQELPK